MIRSGMIESDVAAIRTDSLRLVAVDPTVALEAKDESKFLS
jgi:hypothetical protein